MLKYGDTMNPKYILLAASLLLTASFSEAGTLSTVGRDQWVKVERVFDGDTFRAKSGERVRLLGINAPEVIHETKPGQVFGKRSGALLRRLIQGRIVRLKTSAGPRHWPQPRNRPGKKDLASGPLNAFASWRRRRFTRRL